MSDELGWTIDVCCTCGRLATWPFCVHRDIARRSFDDPWCMAIQVKPTGMSAKRLRAAMLARQAPPGAE